MAGWVRRQFRAGPRSTLQSAGDFLEQRILGGCRVPPLTGCGGSETRLPGFSSVPKPANRIAQAPSVSADTGKCDHDEGGAAFGQAIHIRIRQIYGAGHVDFERLPRADLYLL